jgi:hypothetical protein
MKIFKFHWKKCLFIALILFLSIRVFSQQVFMSGGNALNNYQFLSSDGVDWVVEGHFLWESIKDRQFPFELHVLRPPVYVIFTTLDAMLGGRGYVLSLISALSILITIYYSLKFIENKNHSLFVYLVTFHIAYIVTNKLLSVIFSSRSSCNGFVIGRFLVCL